MVSDFKGTEWCIAVFFGVAVLAGTGLAAHAAGLDKKAAAPEIDRGTAIPVKVVPVLDTDAPLLKLGGKKDKLKLPDRWLRQAPKQRVEEKAFPSTKAGKTAQDAPPKEVKVADAGTKPPPEDAELTKQVDVPLDKVVDAGPPANVDTEGHADGVKEGTETDPLKARAVDLYRQRLIAWFSSRFSVHGSGLPQDELVKLRCGATVQLSADRRVTSYSLSPSGNATFDAAAKTVLESAKNESLPPPPENYPDTVQSSLSLTFVCKENRCD